jgi:aspartyl-tRNA(Asn)/glutamyl-tRNA(Gln) amidotransferase subunit A
VHTVTATAANVHDLDQAGALVREDDFLVYGDAGYQGIVKRPEMKGASAEFRVAMRPGKRRALPDTPDGRLQDLIEAAKSSGLFEHIIVSTDDAEIAEVARKWGAEIQRISLPHTEYAVAIYYIIATAEASSNLARYDGVKYGLRSKGYRDLMEMYTQTRAKGFGEEVKRRIILGTYVLSAGYYEAYYRKASQVRTLMRKDFEEAFQKVDVIVAPTAPTPAFRIGEKKEDPLQMYLSDIHTIPVNLAGIPAISIPCGFSHEGLPIGLQIMGKHFDEGMLLRVAYTFEQNTDFHLKKPRTI